LPQSGNYSTSMKRIRQAKNNESNSSLGILVFVGLTIFFCIELTLILTKGRPFHLFWIACLLISVLTVFFAEKFSFNIAKKIRQRIFMLIVVGSALFIEHHQVPISSVSLSIYPVTRTTEFILRQFIPNHDGMLTKIYAAPTLQKQTIEFRLPNALRQQRKNLRLYLGRHPGSYDIVQLSFGTLMLWQPIALINYTGDKMLKIAGTERTLNHFTLIENNIVRLASINRSRPMLTISADEKQIRVDIPTKRIYIIKLFWFFLCMGSSALIIRHHTPDRMKRRENKAVWIEYLTK